MQIANTDTTYCVNMECTEKCWRHKDNWHFDPNTNYWFMDKCEKCEKTTNF